MGNKKAYIPSQPNKTPKKEKHDDVSFLREKIKILKLKRLQAKEERERKKLEKKLTVTYNEIEKKSEKLKKQEKIAREKLLRKKEEELSNTEVLDLSDLEDTSIIPTINLKDYNKEKQQSKNKESLVKQIFSEDINKLKKKAEKIELKKLEKERLNQKKLDKKESIFSLWKKKTEENKKRKEELRIKKQKEIEKKIATKEAERLKKIEQKKQIKEDREEKKREKLLKQNEEKGIENDPLKMQGLTEQGLKEEKKLKREAEKRRIKEEKERIKQEREEKRKEELKEKYERIAKEKREKEEKRILILREREEKGKKIKKEQDQAREERREKAKLIQKAKEESKAKERKERKSIEDKIKDWYNNLSVVKDRKNRRELQRQTLLIDYESAQAIRSEEKIMYKYVAKNKETDKVESGYFSAFSKLDVLSFLIAEDYEVYEITPQKNIVKSLNLFIPKFKSNDLDFFLTQLSTFLKSGITLIDSVKVLSKQCKNNGQKQVYKSIIYELTMGENFSEALAKQGTVFPKLLVNMVKTSELTGDLPETLDDMANYYKEMEKTRKQMISAITYPLVILLFALTILIFIMIVVIPQFVSIYGDIGADLPGITIKVINTSNFLKTNWMYLIIGVFSFILVFIILFKSIKVFRTVIQTLLMNLPIIGKIIIYNEITMFTKTFGSLLNHNVYITDAMEVLSKITNNEVYKMLIFDTITNLAKGDAISNSFKNNWAFPTIAYEMILTGEKTGQLGNMMNKVAEYYQNEHKNAVNQIKAFIEPVMIVVLAAIVGIILLSVVLPMFDMYQNIG